MRKRTLRLICLASSLSLTMAALSVTAHAQAERVSAAERAAFHRDPQWLSIEPHLPNPQSGTPAALETAADVLRARRFPEDALDFYGYALARGGNVSELLNKMGVVRLELRQNDLAHELFLRTVRENKRDAQAWNNLGVTEYVAGNYHSAVADYHKASKLEPRTAVYRVNMGMAYFESKDMESARKEFSAAMRLDAHLFDKQDGNGGALVHVVGSQNYGQLAYEMARVFARRQDSANTLLWLAKSSEAGYDIKDAMTGDGPMQPYAHDPRVLVLLKNAKQMRSTSVASVTVKSLGPAGLAATPPQQID